MSVLVEPSMQHLPGDRVELVLRSCDNSARVWRRQYESQLAMGFDAHALGLIERTAAPGSERSHSRLRKEASVSLETVLEFRFQQDEVKK